MRNSLATPSALVMAGLLLVGMGTAVSAQAEELLRLDDTALDMVRAGATAGLSLDGAATSTGSLFSSSDYVLDLAGSGNQRSVVASGYVLALGIGASGTRGNATADATTGGSAVGDYTFVRTVNIGGGGGGGFSAFRGSVTAGVALGLEL